MATEGTLQRTSSLFLLGTMYFTIVIWMTCFGGIALGVTVTFEPSKAALSDGVTITCKRSTGSSASITWELNSIPLTSCDGALNNVCIPSPAGYTFSTDVSVNEFNLSLSSTSITDCKTYTCTDASTTTDTVSKEMYLSYWDKTEVTNTEPGANTGGSISISTGCVLSPDDLTITWSKIVNGNTVALSADDPSPVTSTNRSTCTRTCHTEEDKKVTSGFTHTEYTGTDSVTVQYKVTVSHSLYPDNADTFTWTSASYNQSVFGKVVKVTLDKECYGSGTGEDMTISASYDGAFNVDGVIWSYSGRHRQDIVLDPSCSVFQLDAGFPNNRMSFVCPPNTTNSNTYQLILSNLVADDLTSKTWSATFQVSGSSNPDFVTVQPKLCVDEAADLSYGLVVGLIVSCVFAVVQFFVILAFIACIVLRIKRAKQLKEQNAIRNVEINGLGKRSLCASNGSVRVKKITPGGPSDGKLEVGDYILSINGESTAGLDVSDVEKRLTSKSGVLKVTRDVSVIEHLNEIGKPHETTGDRGHGTRTNNLEMRERNTRAQDSRKTLPPIKNEEERHDLLGKPLADIPVPQKN